MKSLKMYNNSLPAGKAEFAVSWLFPILLATSGCESRETLLVKFGLLLSVFYLVLCVVILSMPRIQASAWFQKITKKLRIPLYIFAITLMAGGVAVAGYGFYLWEKKSGLWTLIPCLGAMIIAAGGSLQQWLKADSLVKKVTHMKVFTLSISFGLALLYLISGGAGLDPKF